MKSSSLLPRAFRLHSLSLFLVLAFALVFASPLVLTTGCTTGSTTQATAVTTLKVVGATASQAMATSAQLLKDGKISVAQWQQIADIFDNKFQPSYKLAVVAANSNVNSVASPDLIALAAQLGALILQFQTKTT